MFRPSLAENHGGISEENGPSSPQPHGQEAVEPRHLFTRPESLCEGSASFC